METPMMKKEIRCRKNDSLIVSNTQSKHHDIINISITSDPLSSISVLPTAEQNSTLSISHLSDESRSIQAIENVKCTSRSNGKIILTEIPKTFSEPSRMPYSSKTNISPGHSISKSSPLERGVSESKSSSEKIDVVYLLGNESQWNDNEIRYSLRSLEMWFPHARVFIAGNVRRWMRNVIEIEVPDVYQKTDPGYKEKNVMHKIKMACNRHDLSREFIVMNDDFYFLEYTPYIFTFYKGTMEQSEKESPAYSEYRKAMKKTREMIRIMGITKPLNFAVHSPIKIDKIKFIKMADSIDWRKYGYQYRGVYGNIYERHHAVAVNDDFKIFTIDDIERMRYREMISSSADIVLSRQFQEFIESRFPNPSKYEYK